ncbi:uncharacterized protein [Diadema setosum]|uniref:uncharacterized protein n=1 Tax=Diadema setosum TaxID=31175 RepID=UPI003B3BD2AE
MSKAIVTSRQLKNIDTGLDISVPEFRKVKQLLTTDEEYHVIVITNLPYFKTTTHKPDDVVQFMVPKWYGDFETLHKAMSDRYPATIFPDLPKKVLMVRDSTPQQRRAAFDKLMNFIASTPKVCCSHILLEFLGVRLEKIEAVEGGEKGEGDEKNQEKDSISATTSPTKSVKSQSSSLFGEEDSDDELFKTGKDGAEEQEEEEEDNDLFSPSPHNAPSRTNGASEQGIILTTDTQALTNADLEGGLYLPSGAAPGDGTPTFLALATEDNSDLLNVDEDLDKLLTISTKPVVSPKPSGAATVTKPEVKPRPATAKKPVVAPRPGADTKQSLEALDQSDAGTNLMAEDDIMKYIEENSAESDAKLDLF